MGLFSKGPKGEKCKVCKSLLEKREERLYAMPKITVSHYTPHDKGSWYRDNLVPVESKSQLPSGMYAARVELWRCPSCGKEKAIVRPFLPVRGSEMAEFPVTLECKVIECREDPSGFRVLGEIVNVLADEKVLDDSGNVDPKKLNAFVFDQFQYGYYAIGEKVGQAWETGKALM